MIEDNYVNPSQTTITFPEKKRNLIYIYLESMESTYSDKKDGGAYDHNFIPALTNLALDNINFSNSDKLGGAYPTTGTTFRPSTVSSSKTDVCLNAIESSIHSLSRIKFGYRSPPYVLQSHPDLLH